MNFQHFFDTKETIPPGLSWNHYCPYHLLWLAGMAVFIILLSVQYRKRDAKARAKWRKVLGGAIFGAEMLKLAVLMVTGTYTHAYLPLHLCSLSILLIALHAWRPGVITENYLYGICIPAAMAAMLFPDWTMLPALNYMHLHSFAIHVLLVAYPIMVTVGGDLKPDWRQLPKCLLFIACLAVPVYLFNLKFDTNFMFLMYAEPGNPLLIFEHLLGHHLLGVPVLGTVFIGLMYLILYVCRKAAGKRVKQ